jgi:transposase
MQNKRRYYDFCTAPHTQKAHSYVTCTSEQLPSFWAKEARVFRRAQAVRAVVAGHHVSAVSATFHFTNSALRKWVQRFANDGVAGLVDRPRPGRPRKVTCALAQHLNSLVDQDPLQHGSLSSQWSCRELATVLAHHTGVRLGRESVRLVLKKTTSR